MIILELECMIINCVDIVKIKVLKEIKFIILISITLYCLSFKSVVAEVIISPFNHLELDQNIAKEKLSFLLSGHIYGTVKDSIYPVPSLMRNIEMVNNIESSFIVLLGDIVQRANEVEMKVLQDTLLFKLNAPVFNAPGNHDLSNRDLYIEKFGSTYFQFEIAGSFFIFLDSEASNGKIEGDQLAFLDQQLKYLNSADSIKNVFVFSHRLLWAIGHKKYSQLIPYLNGPSWHPDDATTITQKYLPLFRLLKGKKVFFISGDIGKHYSLPLFYEKEESSNITFIATGMGNTENDLIVEVRIDHLGEVGFSPISLNGAELNNIKEYNLEYWMAYFNNKSTILDYIYYFKNMSNSILYYLIAVNLIVLFFLLFWIFKIK